MRLSREAEALSMRIVKAVEKDLNDRRGFHLDTLDPNIRRGIRQAWLSLIKPLIRDYLNEVVVAEGYVSVIPLQGTRICEEPDPTPRGVYVNHMFNKYNGKRVQVYVREVEGP